MKLSLTFMVDFSVLKKNICFLEIVIVWLSIFSCVSFSSWEDLCLRWASSIRCCIEFKWIRIQHFAHTRSGHVHWHLLSTVYVFASIPFLIILPVIYNLLFMKIVISATHMSGKPWIILTRCSLLNTNVFVKILSNLPSATPLYCFAMFWRLHQFKRLATFIKFEKFCQLLIC